MAQSIPKLLVDFAWYADGVGKIGQIPKVGMPPITKVMEEWTAGGMAGSADIFMGMIEKLESTVTLGEPDAQVFKLMGFANGDEKAFTFRGALGGKGGVENFVVKTTSQISNWAPDDAERKSQQTHELTLTHTTLKIERNGEVLCDIDVEGGRLIIGGVDMRAGINDAIGA